MLQQFESQGNRLLIMICMTIQRSLQEKVLHNETPEAGNLFLNLTIRRAHIMEDSINEVGSIND